MKIFQIKKQLFTIFQFIFWFISFNLWNIILNPGVGSTISIQGWGVDWATISLLNFASLLYCTLPFIWFLKKPKRWIKIAITVVFLIFTAYVILGVLLTDPKKSNALSNALLFAIFFLSNFAYVLIFHLTIIAAVYFNLKVLIPRFFKNSQFNRYLLWATGLCILAAILNYSLFNYLIDLLIPSIYFISYFKIWELILIMAAYLIFTSVLFLVGQYALMLIENRDAARNELSALKAQINPHFLFNNLNTIYSMSTQKDERTPEVILKLSDFLRYVLYDTSYETIPLEKEVEIIRTYIGLQDERVNHEITKISLDLEGDFTSVHIPPLLLLPLVENCFKHGIAKGLCTIKIYVGYDGKQLLFKTENTIARREKSASEEKNGIGIQNVEKRLNLIYPQQHSLAYREKEGIFTLEMRVELIN